MSNTWQPTVIGKFFTGSQMWRMSLNNETFTLEYNDKHIVASITKLPQPMLVEGTFWAKLRFSALPPAWEFEGNSVTLTGIPCVSAKQLLLEISTFKSLIQAEVEEKEERQRQLLKAERAIKHELQAIQQWASNFRKSCNLMYRSKGWLSSEFIESKEASKPSLPASKNNDRAISNYLANTTTDIAADIRLWCQDLVVLADKNNELLLQKVTQHPDNISYFRSIEKSPLSQEQIKAVVCNDSRMLLIAAAGSGKTSTIVAKLGYILQKKYFDPSKVLILAFNRSAAIELQDRVKIKLNGVQADVDNVSIKTFHSLGLSIIGEATGKKPAVADWLDSGKDLHALSGIVKALKKRNAAFRKNWDLFRVVLSNEIAGARTDQDLWEVDGSDSKKRYWTLNGEHVRSKGELYLANWLFYYGVNYKYEQSYCFDTADAYHRQYQPDFYFPDIDTYLELWGLNSRGQPRSDIEGYLEQMEWKRQIHLQNATKLLEVTTAGIFSTKAFSYLKKELKEAGLVLSPKPDRPVKGRQPIKDARLIKIFRTFLSHVKGNRLSIPELRERINSGCSFKYRQRVFLRLFEKIWGEWDSMLSQERCVDFDDMLVSAGDFVEEGKWSNPYDLIMVDEFQDVSFARTRLISELIKGEGKYLFAVGDDWQGINRFSGADPSVMREFGVFFGKGTTLALQKTYRCPQSLCDITSQFVSKNPLQLTKQVISDQSNITNPVIMYRVQGQDKIASAVEKRIEDIAHDNPETHVKILILGRYNRDRRFIPGGINNNHVTVDFMTVHSSKGLEADHVILPNVMDAALGFPSKVEDDPVMQLAMLDGEAFPFAEERRLFYVALTRAKKTVTLVTVLGSESVFLTELVKEHDIELQDLGCDSVGMCRKSGCLGYLVQRKSEHGAFLGCSRYPDCNYTENL